MEEDDVLFPLEKITTGDLMWFILTCNTCGHTSRLFTFNLGPTITKHCAGCVRTNKKHSIEKDSNQKPP